MSSSPAEHSWTLLDFSNAFNSICREAMFVEFRQHIPSLSAWMESCYSCQPILLFGKDSIHSCCGVQQGGPFALTLHPIIERIKAEVPGLGLNTWYLDDGTLVGPPEDLAAALRIFERDGPPLGLHPNRSKSLLYIPGEANASCSPLPSEIPVTRQGFSLLGCPIGPPVFCEAVFSSRIAEVKASLEALRGINDSQLETTLLRSCLVNSAVASVTDGQFTCPECRGSADPFGDHQVGCGGNGDRISRHNAIRDVVFSAAQSAALAPSKKTPNLVPDSSVRPADVLLPNWNRGRPAAVDVHVISPLQQQTLGEAASTPGHALQVGVRRKLVSNLSACRSVGVEFVPFVIETLGGLSEDTISTIRAIGRAVGQRSGTSDLSRTTKHLFGRVAIALWRGNASLWLHRHPTLPPSMDGLM